MQPPQISLQPGSTNTAAVKQLQDWLVANGYMTQAEVNTGYGTYGPRTTAAVQAVQQKLGVDNSTGPGYWGPRTLAAVTASTNVKQPTPTTPTQPSKTDTTAPPAISPQKALLGAIADVAQTAATTGKPPVTFSEALTLAQKDPNIISKYADAAKLDSQSFTQQLQQAQQLYSTQAEQQKTTFENERKALAEQQAAAGTAYSGFRGKAQQDLAQSESGIVTSSRAQLQNSLNQLTSAFESKYGTGATPPAPVSTVNPLVGNVSMGGLKATGGGTETIMGQQAGGITGTQTAAKTADVNQSALQSYQTAQFPAV